jgi:hypothetical protein
VADYRTDLVPVRGKSRLITEVDDPEVLTVERQTDCRTAILRGMREYLEQLQVAWPGGRTSRFVRVVEEFAAPEQLEKYPAASVHGPGTGKYDASRMSPRVLAVGDGKQNLYLQQASELVQPFVIEAWTTDKVERMAIAAMLEDALDPVEWMYGARIELPHYFNLRATYEKLTVAYDETGDDPARRWRRVVMEVTGTLVQAKLVGQIMPMRVRMRTFVDGIEDVEE